MQGIDLPLNGQKLPTNVTNYDQNTRGQSAMVQDQRAQTNAAYLS